MFGGIGPKDGQRIGRVLKAWETGRLNQIEAPPADALPGPVESYLGMTTAAIPALSGVVPGSGPVDLYQISGTVLVAAGVSETAYNLSGSIVASGTYVRLHREPYSGVLVISADAPAASSGSFLGDQVYLTSSHSFPSGTSSYVYDIAWSNARGLSFPSVFWIGGDNTKLTFPQTGYYQISASCNMEIDFVASNSAGTQATLGIRSSAGPNLAGAVMNLTNTAVNLVDRRTLVTNYLAHFTAGDFVRITLSVVFALTTYSGIITADSTGTLTHAEVFKIG